jgi:hypothetical protein
MSDKDKVIIAKYAHGEERLLQESGRIKLPELIEMTKNDKNIIDLGENNNDWDNIKKSKLIESFIINLPVPQLIFSEVGYHKYKIIDGRQRIKAVENYFHNKFSLTGLNVVQFKFNGCKYKDLSPKIQRTLNNCFIGYASIVSNGDLSSKEVNEFLDSLADRYKQ